MKNILTFILSVLISIVTTPIKLILSLTMAIGFIILFLFTAVLTAMASFVGLISNEQKWTHDEDSLDYTLRMAITTFSWSYWKPGIYTIKKVNNHED